MLIPSYVFPYVKVLVSKHIVEVWRYEDMPLPGSDRDGESLEPKSSCDPMEERAKNQRRSKWEFMRRVNCTFDAGSRFVTFTFRDGVLSDVTDVREANSYWNRFMNRMRRRFGNFEWTVVVEFQDSNGRGAVHFHMIANLPYIPKQQLEDIWEGGFVWINAIDKVDNVGAYVVKYMAADLADIRLCGLKAWRTSRNIKKPLELRGDDARDFLEAYGLVAVDCVSSSAYMSEYNGAIQYEQYNLVRRAVNRVEFPMIGE